MKLKISILTVIALTVASCLKNDIVWNSDDVEFRPWEFAAPTVNIHVPLYKTINKEFDFDDLFVDERGVICIRYTHSESMEWDNSIGIRRTSSYGNPWAPIPFPVGSVDVTVPPFKVLLGSSGEVGSHVKEAVLTTGNISFIISEADGLESGSIITVTIPELTNENGVFTEIIELPSSGESYPLEGYTIKTDDNNNFNVTFNIFCTAATSGNLDIQFEISNMDVNYMSGYFGKVQYNENLEIAFNFFDELDFDGTFGFRDVKMNTVITNGAGLPMEVSADVYFGNESGLNEKLNLNPAFELDVSGAAISGNNSVTPSVKTFSAIVPEIEFVNGNYPTKLKFDVTGAGNPNGNPDTDVNFIVKNSDEALTKVDFSLIVPLYVKIGDFSRSDVVGFDYNSMIDDDENFSAGAENITVNLAVVNNLPFEVTLSAIVIDAAGRPVETILPEKNISYKNETQDISIQLNKNQLERFRAEEVKNIVLYTSAKTPNESYVEVKEDASLDIAVSIDIKAALPNIF